MVFKLAGNNTKNRISHRNTMFLLLRRKTFGVVKALPRAFGDIFPDWMSPEGCSPSTRETLLDPRSDSQYN